MDPVMLIRVALEAATAVQLGLFAVFVIASADIRRPAGFFITLICAGVVVMLGLNVLTSAGLPPAWRTANYFIDLALGPLLLGFVGRAGDEGATLRFADTAYGLGVALGALALVAGGPYGPDVFMLASLATYLVAAAWVAHRRQAVLEGAGLLGFARVLLAGFAVMALLRLLVVIDARSVQTYRDSAAYIAVLAVGLALANFMIWAALRRPGLMAWRQGLSSRPMDPDTALELEGRLVRLVDEHRVYLQPDLTLAAVAARLNAPSRQVSHIISTRLGANFSDYMNRKRAEAAAAALRSESRLPITTIMFDSGFGSKSAFQREFKRRFGVSPTEYRRQAP